MAAKVKTRDRILKTALALFNSEGEAQVSTVDIAAVLDISPGNLYYHFKGKEAIIEALFDAFETEMRQVLGAPIARKLALEDNWIFVYIVFEEINDFRFFYESISSILERRPALGPRFSRLLSLKRSTILAILAALESEGVVAFIAREKEMLADRLAAHLTFALQFRSFSFAGGAPPRSPQSALNYGVYSTVVQVAPYLVGGREAFLAFVDQYFAAQPGEAGPELVHHSRRRR